MSLEKIAPLALVIVGHAHRNVEILYASMMRVVPLVLQIVDHVHLQHLIVVMDNVILILKIVPIVLVIVEYVNPIVEMDNVNIIIMRTASYVQAIVEHVLHLTPTAEIVVVMEMKIVPLVLVIVELVL